MKTYTIELDDVLGGHVERFAKEDARTTEAFLALMVHRWAYGNGHQMTDEEYAAYKAARPPKVQRISLTAKQRNQIFERGKGLCAYCDGLLLYNERWHVDHIKPISKGGTNDLANLALSCQRCNVKKHNKLLPETGV